MASTVGFLITANVNRWSGGINYFKRLLDDLAEHTDDTVALVVLTGTDNKQCRTFAGPRVTVVRSPLLDERIRYLRTALKLLFSRDVLVNWLLERHAVTRLFSTHWIGRCVARKLLWVPDYQFLHYPEYFGWRSVRHQHRQVRRMARDADVVVLSSDAAFADFRELSDEYSGKVKVLRFRVREPVVDERAVGRGLRMLVAQTPRYYYCPNQQWAHKNHRLLIDVAERYRQTGRELVIVLSGRRFDHRNRSGYRLEEEIRERGVEDKFRTLGQLRYDEVIYLMRNCHAMVNPSLFEGWHSGVEEARALGRLLLLSDIPVHREQAGSEAIYFDPRDAASAADAFARADLLDTASPGPARVRDYRQDYRQYVGRLLEVFDLPGTKEASALSA